MAKILGLDASTTVVGVALLDDSNIELLDHIEFKGMRDIWSKTEHVEKVFASYVTDPAFAGIDGIFIEDAAKRFTPGMSSADTIALLTRFNALVSWLARRAFSVDPEYIAPTSMRKLCGIKIVPKKKCGLSHKEQAFNYMAEHDLKDVVWPKKQRSENMVDWAYDVTDAYCVAKAGTVIRKSGATSV